MKSPLMAILLHLGLLKRPVAALAENTQEILRTAVSATEMLSQMVNDLLDVSRLEEGKMPVERAIWDLTRMAGEVRETLAAMDRGRRIDVETSEAVPVSCDGAIIRRTLENLLGNAIKHTPAGTPVRISIARRTGRVRVEVHDEGDGVPAGSPGEDLRKIRNRSRPARALVPLGRPRPDVLQARRGGA